MTLRRVYDSIPARYSACLLLICILSAAKAEDNDNHYPNVIQVNGTGHVTVAPDRADLSLSVEVQAKNAETARNQAAASMTALINAVKNQEVASEDIQTRHVSLHPVYAPSSANKVTGYQLANQVTVVIRDIDKISAIIDGAVMAGGNAVRVQGIRFAVEQPDIALSKAREKAYAAARAKAEQY
ncbi:MAG: SIMPL domain-containing protein, partial [Gammaproteobacteria bacterium]